MSSHPTPRHSTSSLVRRRQRGLNAGELMVSLAETVMVGGDHLVHLDQLRGDLAGAELRAAAMPPAPTTASQLLKGFQVDQCRAVVAATSELGNHFSRQHELPVSAPVTLDMDGSLSEVYLRLAQGAGSSEVNHTSLATPMPWTTAPHTLPGRPDCCVSTP